MATIDRDVWPKSADPKKLAVIIAGAGSLGSYEAGVLSELWYALDTLNGARETLADGTREGPFVIDVLTGASAGGMTAAMTGRSILYEADQRARLHSAWVREVTMKAFLEEEPTQGSALFSKKVVGEIADRHLGGPLQGTARSASFAPDVLRLGMTLTNMNGLDYQLFTRSLSAPGPGFLTTRFSDRALFTLPKGRFADVPWPDVRTSAIATGNFPLAFMPQGLLRQRVDYMSKNPALQTRPAVPPGRDYFPHALACIDGGMFDNEPVGLAINFAAEADGGQIDRDRLFLLVHPNITKSAHDDQTGAGVGYLSDTLALGDQIKRLLAMLMTENAVNDWVRAQKVNELVTWRDGFVRELTRIISVTRVQDAPTLVANLSALARTIALRRSAGDPDGYLAASRARIAIREDAFFASLGGPPPTETVGQQVFLLLLFILDHLSELQDKQAVWLEVIGHDEALPLAGASVNGFAGFFEEEWRAYDYRRGRLDAWNTFTGRGGTAFGLLGDYTQEPRATQPSGPAAADPDEYTVDLAVWRARLGQPDFPAVTFDDIPKDLRGAFVDRVADRVKALLGISGLTAVAFNLFVKPKIEKMLAGGPS
jgi:predicted acylesterase/phospholipase RssA